MEWREEEDRGCLLDELCEVLERDNDDGNAAMMEERPNIPQEPLIVDVINRTVAVNSTRIVNSISAQYEQCVYDVDRVVAIGLNIENIPLFFGREVWLSHSNTRQSPGPRRTCEIVHAPAFLYLDPVGKGALARELVKWTGHKFLPISNDRDVFLATSSPRKVTARDLMMCLGELDFPDFGAVDFEVFGQKASLASYDFLKGVGTPDEFETTRFVIDIGTSLNGCALGRIPIVAPSNGRNVEGTFKLRPMFATTTRHLKLQQAGTVEFVPRLGLMKYGRVSVRRVKIYSMYIHFVKAFAPSTVMVIPRTFKGLCSRIAQLRQLSRFLEEATSNEELMQNFRKIRVEVTLAYRGSCDVETTAKTVMPVVMSAMFKNVSMYGIQLSSVLGNFRSLLGSVDTKGRYSSVISVQRQRLIALVMNEVGITTDPVCGLLTKPGASGLSTWSVGGSPAVSSNVSQRIFGTKSSIRRGQKTRGAGVNSTDIAASTSTASSIRMPTRNPVRAPTSMPSRSVAAGSVSASSTTLRSTATEVPSVSSPQSSNDQLLEEVKVKQTFDGCNICRQRTYKVSN